MNRIIASLLIFAAFVVAPLASSAAPITVPTDLSVGDKYRLAFVTNTVRNATSSNIADYNAFVTGVATGVTELAALGTTWNAIGSTATVDARDNTGTNPSSTGVPIYRLDDTRIADGNVDLWDGDIGSTMSINETGTLVPSQVVWTGTGVDGTGVDGPLGVSSVFVGLTSTTTFAWVAVVERLPFEFHPVYAMSAVLTVVPEPSTLFLVCIGATAVVGWQFRRRRHRKH